MRTSFLFLAISFLFLSINTFSQSADVSLKKVFERRTSIPFGSALMLKMQLKGFKEPLDGRKIKVIEAYALNEDGDTLRMTNSRWEFFSVFDECSINLELPSRKTRKLSRVWGKVKVFTPSEAKGSIISIRDFLSKRNQNLLEEYDQNLKLAILDSIDYDAFFEEFRAAYRKSLLEQDPDLSEAAIQDIFKTVDLQESSIKKMEQEGKLLRIVTNDQNGDIIRLDVNDGEGKDLVNKGVTLYSKMNDRIAELLHLKDQQFQHFNLMACSLDIPTDENLEIEIVFANKQSCEEYTFALYDVILP